MAKKSQALIAAEARIAALEARLTIARDVYRAQRAQIAELEAQLNTRGVKGTVVGVRKQPESTVTTFTRRDGVTCERIRTGNRAVVREVRLPECSLPGVETRELPLSHVAAFEAML